MQDDAPIYTATLAHPAKATLGEGPVWFDDALWFVDIYGPALCRFEPERKSFESFPTEKAIGFAVPTESGDWIVAAGSTIARWTPGEGMPDTVREVEPVSARSRLNDGKTDPTGRLYAGTITDDRKPNAALYRFDGIGCPTAVVPGVTISNGLAWDVAKSCMYYIDTPTKKIERFDWDAERGEISNRRAVFTFGPDDGWPDGMTIDREGLLWVGLWGGSRVARVDPEAGREIGSIPMPCPNVTSCCFGGAALTDLYITTARTGMSAEQLEASPQAGGLFRAQVGVSGFATTLLRGLECP